MATAVIGIGLMFGSLRLASEREFTPSVQDVPADVEKYLRSQGGRFDIQPAGRGAAVPAQSAARTVVAAGSVEVGRTAVVHGQISYVDGRRQLAWLVVAVVKGDASVGQRPTGNAMGEIYGLVDSGEGSLIWTNMQHGRR